MVVFVGGRFRAYTVELDNFALAGYDSAEGVGTWFVLANVNSTSARIVVVDGKSRSENAFVVEALPSYINVRSKFGSIANS